MIVRLVALALPVLAGLGWAWAGGASRGALFASIAALVLGAAFMAVPRIRRVPPKPAGLFLIAVLLATAAVGLEVEGARRWLDVGFAVLTSGLVCMPPLAVLAARVKRGWLIGGLVTTFLAGLLQPDGAILLALAGIVAGLGGRNIAIWVAAVLCGLVGGAMALFDTLPTAPFVERIVQDAATQSVPAAVGLVAAFTASLGLIVWLLPRRGVPSNEARALTGCLAGLFLASLLGPFPTPLLGLAPSAIIGTGLALAMLGRTNRAA